MSTLSECYMKPNWSSISPYLFVNRQYQIPIFLMQDVMRQRKQTVIKTLKQKLPIQLSLVVAAETKTLVKDAHRIIQTVPNPIEFSTSGQSSAIIRFVVPSSCCSPSGFRVKFAVDPSLNIVPVLSPPFTVVRHTIAITWVTEKLRSNDNKWYKDEGGKNNFLDFRVELRDHTNSRVVLAESLPLDLQLCYEDHSAVENGADILTIRDRETPSLDRTGRGEISIRVEEVSNHHQKKKFRLKISAALDDEGKNDQQLNPRDIAPCYTRAINVLSKRNKRRPKATSSSPTKKRKRRETTPTPSAPAATNGRPRKRVRLSAPADVQQRPPARAPPRPSAAAIQQQRRQRARLLLLRHQQQRARQLARQRSGTMMPPPSPRGRRQRPRVSPRTRAGRRPIPAAGAPPPSPMRRPRQQQRPLSRPALIVNGIVRRGRPIPSPRGRGPRVPPRPPQSRPSPPSTTGPRQQPQSASPTNGTRPVPRKGCENPEMRPPKARSHSPMKRRQQQPQKVPTSPRRRPPQVQQRPRRVSNLSAHQWASIAALARRQQVAATRQEHRRRHRAELMRRRMIMMQQQQIRRQQQQQAAQAAAAATAPSGEEKKSEPKREEEGEEGKEQKEKENKKCATPVTIKESPGAPETKPAAKSPPRRPKLTPRQQQLMYEQRRRQIAAARARAAAVAEAKAAVVAESQKPSVLTVQGSAASVRAALARRRGKRGKNGNIGGRLVLLKPMDRSAPENNGDLVLRCDVEPEPNEGEKDKEKEKDKEQQNGDVPMDEDEKKSEENEDGDGKEKEEQEREEKEEKPKIHARPKLEQIMPDADFLSKPTTPKAIVENCIRVLQHLAGRGTFVSNVGGVSIKYKCEYCSAGSTKSGDDIRHYYGCQLHDVLYRFEMFRLKKKGITIPTAAPGVPSVGNLRGLAITTANVNGLPAFINTPSLTASLFFQRSASKELQRQRSRQLQNPNVVVVVPQIRRVTSNVRRQASGDVVMGTPANTAIVPEKKTKKEEVDEDVDMTDSMTEDSANSNDTKVAD